MSITARSRSHFESVVDRLESDYGSFPVVDKEWSMARSVYENVRDRFDEDGAGGAGVWLTDEAGRVLLVRNEGDDGWSDPGGKRDPGESFETAARREVREETGVDCRITGLSDVHRVQFRDEIDPDRPPIVVPIVIFEGEHVAGDPRPREGEIADVAWFVEPPQSVLYEEIRTRSYPATD